jgi:hypothetical protein
MNYLPPAKLASEDISVNSPLSYAGSSTRIWRMTRHVKLVTVPLALILVTLAWVFVTLWYVITSPLFIWLVIWRGFRRNSRMNKVTAMRHRELLQEASRR